MGHQKTTCFGFATNRNGEKGNEVVKQSDDALYNAKEGGRNRVVASVLNGHYWQIKDV